MITIDLGLPQITIIRIYEVNSTGMIAIDFADDPDKYRTVLGAEEAREYAMSWAKYMREQGDNVMVIDKLDD